MSDEQPTPPEETPSPAEPEAAAAEQPSPAETATATAVAEPAEPPSKKKWYVVKVQSGREDSIKANLERRIKLENLEPYVGRVVIPVEKITEVRDGKRRIKKVKKFPGYLFCEV